MLPALVTQKVPKSMGWVGNTVIMRCGSTGCAKPLFIKRNIVVNNNNNLMM
jgi:hypothetical protein